MHSFIERTLGRVFKGDAGIVLCTRHKKAMAFDHGLLHTQWNCTELNA